MQSAHFVWGQEDSKWLVFKHDSVVNTYSPKLMKSCSFLNIGQDTNQFMLYQYGIIQNIKGKPLYCKFTYSGQYALTEDSAVINLMPSNFESHVRIEDQVRKEEKSLSEDNTMTLFLNPYRLILFGEGAESLFTAGSIYINTIVCRILDNDQMNKYNSTYEEWEHGQFEYPPIDSTLMIDSNRYFLEIPELTWDEIGLVERYFYEQKKKGVEFLMFDFDTSSDDLYTFISESSSNHVLIYKHYLLLRNDGYSVSIKIE